MEKIVFTQNRSGAGLMSQLIEKAQEIGLISDLDSILLEELVYQSDLSSFRRDKLQSVKDLVFAQAKNEHDLNVLESQSVEC